MLQQPDSKLRQVSLARVLSLSESLSACDRNGNITAHGSPELELTARVLHLIFKPRYFVPEGARTGTASFLSQNVTSPGKQALDSNAAFLSMNLLRPLW